MTLCLSVGKKRKKYLESPILPSDNGLPVDTSLVSEHREGIGDTVRSPLILLLERPKKRQRVVLNTSTVESPHTDRKTTSKGRSSRFNQYIQNIALSLTLDQESTSKGKDLKPFWNSQCQEISKNLWLPIETDLQDSQRNLLHGSSVGTAGGLSIMTKQNSPFQDPQKWISQRTFLPSLLTSQQEPREDDVTVLKTMKVRIYPTWGQRQWMIQTMYKCRALRNQAIALEREGKLKPSELSKGKVGEKFITTSKRKAEFDDDSDKWKAINSIPGHIRKQTLLQLGSNYKTAFTLLKNKQIKHFKMKFSERKVKKGRLTVNIDATKVKVRAKNNCELEGFLSETKIMERYKEGGKYIYKEQKFGTIRYKLQGSERRRRREKRAFPNIKGKFSIVYEEPGRWFFCVSYEKPVRKTIPKYKDISMDPGLRNFQNFYSNDAKVVGTIDMQYMKTDLSSLINQIRYAQFRKTLARTKRESTRWLNRFYFLWNKFKNKKNDLHWKTIRFLVDNFETIYIGDMGSQFIQKNKELGKKNKRTCTFLSHYQFRTRLLETATRTIVVVPESYTTKHCTGCGKINEVGRSKVYHCEGCGITLGRDENGARNIHIKGQCSC